jgi:hypothetical protein
VKTGSREIHSSGQIVKESGPLLRRPLSKNRYNLVRVR